MKLSLFSKKKEKQNSDESDKIKDIGKRGEQSAASFLCGKGFEIVGRNVRTGHLETDIIAKNDKYLVFAEVKTRHAYPFKSRPSDAVDKSKHAKIKEAATLYYNRHKSEYSDLIPRLDVVEVYLDPKREDYKVLKIYHMVNPF